MRTQTLSTRFILTHHDLMITHQGLISKSVPWVEHNPSTRLMPPWGHKVNVNGKPRTGPCRLDSSYRDLRAGLLLCKLALLPTRPAVVSFSFRWSSCNSTNIVVLFDRCFAGRPIESRASSCSFSYPQCNSIVILSTPSSLRSSNWALWVADHRLLVFWLISCLPKKASRRVVF